MSNSREITISEFLTSREDRFKADDPAISKLNRIEKIDFSGNVFTSQKPSKTDMVVIRPGDFVISGINVAKGAMAIYYGKEPVKATIHYSSYIVNQEVINLEYFKRFLKSPIFIKLLKDQVAGGIKTEIKPKHLLPLKIQLPTLSQQKTILQHALNTEEEYKQLTTEITKQTSLLKKYRQAILQEAIEGKLTEDWRAQNPNVETAAELLKRISTEKAELIKQKKISKQKPLPAIKPDEIPFEIPKTWQWCQLADVLYENTRNGYSAKPVPYPTNTVTLKLGATTTGKFINTEIKYINETIPNDSYLWLKPGDILIQRSNSLEHVGVSAIFPGFTHPVIYPDLMMKLQFSKHCNTKYSQILLSASFYRDYFRTNARGAQKSMPKINQKIVCKTPYALPPIAEQQEIVRRVKAKFTLCDKLEAEINASKHTVESLSSAILQELFDQNNETC